MNKRNGHVMSAHDEFRSPLAKNIERELAFKEFSKAFIAAFQTLSHNQQLIIYMLFFEKLPEHEVVKEMLVTRQAVSAAKFRALQQLAKKLKEYKYIYEEFF